MVTTKIDTFSDVLATAVTDLLLGESPALRAEAARTLGGTESSVAATYLIRSLSDSEPEVRLAAVEALSAK